MEDSAPKSPALPVQPDGETALPSASPGEPLLHEHEHEPNPLIDGWIGRVLDERYRIERLLGEGGMGAVYVAEHLSLRKSVALKVVRAELAGNGEVATRFAREAMATAQFEHPHVASAIDYGTLPEGGAYFVMQLVRGKSLRTLLAHEDKLPWRRACAIIGQVADALSAAKAVGIVHRDLKPDNILVEAREDGSDLVKVLDFGIARVAPRDAPGAFQGPAGAQVSRELTRVGTVMGTPGYMAPEQAVGDRVDHRADLYALGVVLWECISGSALWEAPDLTSVVTKQMTQPVPKLAVVTDPSVPLELDELIQRLTARMPADRPDSSGDVRDTLQKLAVAPEVSGLFQNLNLGPQRFSQGVEWARAKSAEAQLVFRALPPPKKKRALGIAGVALLALVSAAVLVPRTAKAPLTLSQLMSEVVDDEPDEPEVPEELAANLNTLLTGKTLRERREAGQALLSYGAQDRIAEPIKLLAELEVASGCKARRKAIESMLATPDPRFVPPILKRHEAPRSGCGFLDFQDCYGCNRADLKRAVEQLEKLYPPEPNADAASAPATE